MTQTQAHVDTEVSVIGAGPVGSLLSGILALNDIDVCIFDESVDVLEGPRAMAVNARAAQIFDVLDLKDGLLTASPSAFGHYGRQKVDLGCVDTPWPGMWPILQQALNQALIDWALEAGAQLVRGTRYLSSRMRPDGMVHAAFSGSLIKSSSSRILVGCDGEDSAVRLWTGMGQTAVAGERRFVTANVRAADMPTYRFEPFADGAVVSSGQIEDQLHRIMMHVPAAAPAITTARDVEIAWAQTTGAPLQGKVLSWGLQTDRRVVSDSFRDGEVVLAGDAAHSQLPVGGCSLNYGIEDAFNLAWRIKHTIDTGTSRLLDDYAAERKFAARRLHELVNTQVQELYETYLIDRGSAGTSSATGVQDPAAFLSGTDIDYSSCGTNTEKLLSPARVSLTHSQLLGLKDAQRSLQYSRIGSIDGSFRASPSLQKLRNIEQRSELHGPTSDQDFLLVRPDGYVLTNA
ncbi:NAD(P)/FAD-dependent oxidoreductase [Microbacterium sp. SORGH_AS_0888]|uniref:FAD-dependent oxidoreductase n=1 Tax=Microbacterium sp. SORGH_AS_0888 TaxID=3041791 RepID=UPI0027856351|nr:FAD-dependent monooxygenase [Microbacterium sp. SORGH_AS_0888]MDQ1128964.1 2-polyprenyl-6-methoxyphenol hydroxylase-like FAD-dependent oxidoreductase [Microbacterium sp. SORGH_AS_0888]